MGKITEIKKHNCFCPDCNSILSICKELVEEKFIFQYYCIACGEQPVFALLPNATSPILMENYAEVDLGLVE